MILSVEKREGPKVNKKVHSKNDVINSYINELRNNFEDENVIEMFC